MSCSRTGMSICSRSGRSRTVALSSPALDLEPLRHRAVERVDVVANHDHLARLVASETTSPLRNVYDGIVTRLPFTST